MAKQALSKTGWISFTGLRFAKKFATREEIVRAVKGFFSRRGLNFGELKVEFRREARIIWGDTNFSPLTTTIFVGEIETLVRRGTISDPRMVLLHTLFHELDHVAWRLEGKQFDYWFPYEQRVYETHARKVADEETQLFLA